MGEELLLSHKDVDSGLFLTSKILLTDNASIEEKKRSTAERDTI